MKKWKFVEAFFFLIWPQVPPQWCWCCHHSYIPGKYYRIHHSPRCELWMRQRAADVWSSPGQRLSEEISLWQASNRCRTLNSLIFSKLTRHSVSVRRDAISECFGFLSLKGADIPWWQALLDRMGHFCTTAQSTLGPMRRRWVLRWVALSVLILVTLKTCLFICSILVML